MQTNQEIFLLVAEEMSISRAAERAYVSQQCVSDHIKRLESSYGVRLFTRKPRFQLTEAGAAMLESFQKIKIIETSLHNNLSQRAKGMKGHFTMGIGASRAQVFLPLVMPDYNKHFPNVDVHFLMNDTMILEEHLRKGRINLFLGINTPYKKDLAFTPVCEDRLCFMISDGLLRRHFKTSANHILNHEVDLKEFENIPFIKSYSTSTINSVFQEHLDENHISLQFPYQLSDTNTQISLCAKGLGAAISTNILISYITTHNAICIGSEYIHVLPVKNLNRILHIDLVSLKDIDKPYYVREFETMFVTSVQNNL